jgi:hypothetical protein
VNRSSPTSQTTASIGGDYRRNARDFPRVLRSPSRASLAGTIQTKSRFLGGRGSLMK